MSTVVCQLLPQHSSGAPAKGGAAHSGAESLVRHPRHRGGSGGRRLRWQSLGFASPSHGVSNQFMGRWFKTSPQKVPPGCGIVSTQRRTLRSRRHHDASARHRCVTQNAAVSFAVLHCLAPVDLLSEFVRGVGPLSCCALVTLQHHIPRLPTTGNTFRCLVEVRETMIP